MAKVGIVGGTGYTGSELLRLLARHPQAEVAVITSRSEAGLRVDGLFPSLRGQVDLAFRKPDEPVLSACDLVFFATPNGTAMKMVPGLLQQGVKVIDLAADFRLREVSVWEQWYGMQHACTELL
jgi:N-acetyl-gamma-glutamyl-phosphate reductase